MVGAETPYEFSPDVLGKYNFDQDITVMMEHHLWNELPLTLSDSQEIVLWNAHGIDIWPRYRKILFKYISTENSL